MKIMTKHGALKFGCDPEFGVVPLNSEDGFYVLPPAYFRFHKGLVASNDPKHPVFFEGPEFKIHQDGVAFEIGTPPSEDPFEIVKFCHHAQEKLAEMVNPHGGRVVALPTLPHNFKRWENEGDNFRDTLIFGCDPDHSARNQQALCPVLDVSVHPERYFGGHWHMSGHPIFKEAPVLAILFCMVTIGVSASGYSDVPELEKARTFLYGKPDKYRIQKYPGGVTGIEYRTPSVRWSGIESISLAEKLVEALELVAKLFDNVDKGLDILNEVEEAAASSILACDQKSAKDVLSFVKAEVK